MSTSPFGLRTSKRGLAKRVPLCLCSDTKLVAKSIISEILTHARTLAYDGGAHKSETTQNNGRRVLYYLLVPRSLRHFPPATVLLLSESDEGKRKTSKKDDDVREREIRSAASGEGGMGAGGLLRMIELRERLDEMCRDPGASVLVGEIMLYAEGGEFSSYFFGFWHEFSSTRCLILVCVSE